MKIAFTHAFPVLPVRDLPAALAFDESKLGFVMGWRAGDDFAAVSCGDVSLFLEAGGSSAGVRVVLNVTDADEVHALYADRAVEIVQPLATESWGMREFTVADPDGNRLTIGHVDESAAD